MTTAQGRINQGRVDFAALWARDTLFGRRMLTPIGHGSLHEEDGGTIARVRIPHTQKQSK
jgi:hypothetical protein